MWENLLTAGLTGGANHYPDSGPGSKNLIAGDEQAGYFGEVPTSLLFTSDQLCNELGGYYPGVRVPEETTWIKFFYQGKILFIPKRAIRSGVSWNELYENGLVYGVHGNGKYPTATPTDQFRQVAKADGSRQWSMLVRLPTVMGVDPSAAPSPTSAGTDEWSQLFYRLIAGNTGVVPKWDEQGSAGFMVTDRGVQTMHSWGMESQNTANANKAVGGYFSSMVYRNFEPGGAVSRTNANFGTGYFGWRPVLELVPVGKINSPYKVNNLISGPKQVTIRDAIAQTGVTRPQYAHPANWKYGAITIKEPTWALNFPRQVLSNTISPDLKTFAISGSYVA